MDLTYPPEAEEFRTRDPGLAGGEPPGRLVRRGLRDDRARSASAFNEEWTTKLYEGGWICATWPTEYGGKGLSLMQGVVLAEEFARAKAPLRADFFGDTLVGPDDPPVGHRGAEEGVPAADHAGQDRAGARASASPTPAPTWPRSRPSAVLDGDEWVINGQKVWTTQAQFADYCFLLARTDPDAAKHAGISYLLVPMQQPGIEVRPIIQPDGTAEFNEVFFDDARCPKDNVVGGLNNGWAVANTTLGFERGQSATTGYRRFERSGSIMVAEATAQRRDRRPGDPPAPRAATTPRSRSSGSTACAPSPPPTPAEGPVGRRRSAPPTRCSGPRCTRRPWSWPSTSTARAPMLADVGPGVGLVAGRAARARARRLPGEPDVSTFFFSRSETIWGGTVADPAQHRRRAGARASRRSRRPRRELARRRAACVGGDAAVGVAPPHRLGATAGPVPGDVVPPVAVEVACRRAGSRR